MKIKYSINLTSYQFTQPSFCFSITLNHFILFKLNHSWHFLLGQWSATGHSYWRRELLAHAQLQPKRESVARKEKNWFLTMVDGSMELWNYKEKGKFLCNYTYIHPASSFSIFWCYIFFALLSLVAVLLKSNL